MSYTYAEFKKYTKQFPPITREREQELLARIREGDEEATELLIKHNSRRILRLAHQALTGHTPIGHNAAWARWVCGNLPLDDCIMIAAEAFLEAARLYDPYRYSHIAKARVRFGSWANMIMQQRLRRALVREKLRRERLGEVLSYEEDARLGGRCPFQHNPEDIIDSERELGRELFWDRVDELLSKKDAAILRDFCCKQPTGAEGKVVRHKADKVLEKLKKRMPEAELRAYWRMLS